MLKRLTKSPPVNDRKVGANLRQVESRIEPGRGRTPRSPGAGPFQVDRRWNANRPLAVALLESSGRFQAGARHRLSSDDELHREVAAARQRGGVVMKTWIPGIFDTLPCTSGRIPVTVRLRSAQGFTTTPLEAVGAQRRTDRRRKQQLEGQCRLRRPA